MPWHSQKIEAYIVLLCLYAVLLVARKAWLESAPFVTAAVSLPKSA